jgi:putative transposase
VRIEPVRVYLQLQAEHHGYATRILPPVYRYRAERVVQLSAAHSSFDLNHHVVLVTKRRAGVFGSQISEELGGYWLRVAAKRGFAIDQMTVVPDHVHLLVRTVPKLSIEECILSLMNNGQHFIATAFPDALIRAKVDQLWQPSAFAGTRGRMTTALLKTFLNRTE